MLVTLDNGVSENRSFMGKRHYFIVSFFNSLINLRTQSTDLKLLPQSFLQQHRVLLRMHGDQQ